MEPMILVAMITAIGGVSAAMVSGMLSVYNTRTARKAAEGERQKRIQAEQEMEFTRTAIRFTDAVEEWSQISDMIQNVMQRTKVDRFLILRAWNGTHDPRWTTAVHQIREANQQPYQYIHVELDEDYVDRIRRVVQKGQIRFNVEGITPPSLIKEIYDNEGVTDAVWAHLGTYKHTMPHSDAVVVEYVSFATHDEAGFDATCLTEINLIIGRIRGLSHSFVADENIVKMAPQGYEH